MINNDVLRSLSNMLDWDAAAFVAVTELSQTPVRLAPIELAQMQTYLLRHNHADHQDCPDRVLEDVLNGLIVKRRGARNDVKPSAPPAANAYSPLTNNTILKKLRIAFELQEPDMLALMSTPLDEVSRLELGAYFRSMGHKHYRACPDELLLHFLKSLEKRMRMSRPAR